MDKTEKYEEGLVSLEPKLKGARLGGWLLGIVGMVGCLYYAKEMDSAQPRFFGTPNDQTPIRSADPDREAMC